MLLIRHGCTFIGKEIRFYQPHAAWSTNESSLTLLGHFCLGNLWDLPQLRALLYLIDLSRTSWTTSNTGISPTLRTKLLCLPLTSFNLLFKFGNLNFFPFPTSFFLPWFLKFYFRPKYTWTPPADCL